MQNSEINIHDTNEHFPFAKINISKPISTAGNFLIKFTIDGMPIYVNPPKCTMKAVPKEEDTSKRTRRTFCDFMFSSDNDGFLKWVESLEEYAQNILYENRNKWFSGTTNENSLEKEDIEDAFNPILKIKSGKNLLRATIPYHKPGERNTFKIFNENEQEITFDTIDETQQILCVLEIRGIKFSNKSFQVEIELKQMMVLNPVVLFDKCILRSKKSSNSLHPPETTTTELGYLGETTTYPDQTHPPVEGFQFQPEFSREELQETETEETKPLEEDSRNLEENEIHMGVDRNDTGSSSKSNIELYKVELDLDNLPEEEPVQLRNRNDVYYEMYIEAKRKAKIARDLALAAYLEARRIKNTYMLNDIIDSDDEEEDDEEDSSDEDSDPNQRQAEYDEKDKNHEKDDKREREG